MKNTKPFILALVSLFILTSAHASSWNYKSLSFEGSKIRSGIKLHTNSTYKGSVLFLQGLGDSMLNHDPLFNHLNRNGYDVVAFDFRGQGGSGGSMNQTRIANINVLAEKVWNKYKSPKEKKILLGWSTGGLAAYMYAYKKPGLTRAVVLLAPGIVTKLLVGETSIWGCFSLSGIVLNLCKVNRITQASLTQNNFVNTRNPHREKIRPNSPLAVPKFAMNLLKTSRESRKWKMPKSVKGMVYLSSPSDTYVDAKKTIAVLKKNASHFDYYQFGNGALHELDNELNVISSHLRRDIVRFLNR